MASRQKIWRKHHEKEKRVQSIQVFLQSISHLVLETRVRNSAHTAGCSSHFGLILYALRILLSPEAKQYTPAITTAGVYRFASGLFN